MSGDKCGSTAGYAAHTESGTETCRPCRDAQAAWQRDYEIRRYLAGGPLMLDGTGTRRRLRALSALGWPRHILAERVGTAMSYTGELMYAERVRPDTAARVAAAYDELSMTVGPSRVSAARAKAKGWLPPLAYDDETIDDPAARPARATDRERPFDEIAVEQAMRGNNVHLRPEERAEAVRRLTTQGFSASEIAVRLRTTKRSVNRHRAASEKAA